jgi:diguanylate cyclase (GGDEF)-like protein
MALTPLRLFAVCILAGLPLLLAFTLRDEPRGLPIWFWPTILATVGAVALLAAAAHRLSQIHLRLTSEMMQRQRVQQALVEANEHLACQLTEIMSLRDQLREQTVRDPLTGLVNRRYVNEILDTEVSRARRSGQPLSVVTLDVDHFKRINDTHGYLGGDEALKAVAGLLAARVRAGDVAFRYGGDSLALILPDMSLETALDRAEAWRQAVNEMDLLINGTVERLTISLGVATYPHHGHEREALLQSADQALYLAKATGRNQVTALPVFAELPAALRQPTPPANLPVHVPRRRLTS